MIMQHYSDDDDASRLCCSAAGPGGRGENSKGGGGVRGGFRKIDGPERTAQIASECLCVGATVCLCVCGESQDL